MHCRTLTPLALALTLVLNAASATADPAEAPATQPTSEQHAGGNPASASVGKLDTVIPVNFEANSLDAVVDYIRTTTDENIFVNWPALYLIGVEQELPITLQLNRAPAAKVLDLVLQQATAAADGNEPIGWRLMEGTVVISTQRELGKDAKPAPATQPRGAAAPATQPAQAEPVDRLQTTIMARFKDYSMEAVLEYIAAATGENIVVDWAALELVGVEKHLPITLTLRAKGLKAEKVFDLVLKQASAAAGDLDPIGWQRDGDVVLVSTVRELKRRTVETAVYDIRPVLYRDLLVQVPDFEDAPTFDLTVGLSSTSGGGGNGGGGGIFGDASGEQSDVSPAARQTRPVGYLNRLNAPRPRPEPAPPAGGGGEAIFGGDGSDDDEMTREEIIREVTDLIIMTIGTPDEWIDQESTLSELNGNLIVKTHPDNHREIQKLIAMLRVPRVPGGEGFDEGAAEGDQPDPDAAPELPDPELLRFEAQQRFLTESYDRIDDNPFVAVADHALSTFSVDVDTASYANIRRFLTDNGHLPPADAVRIEEMVNYFDYAYAPPAVVDGPEGAADTAPFAAHVEVTGAPWTPGHRLVRIGIKGLEVEPGERPAANLVFLLDVSGSMNSPEKLPLVVKGMKTLAGQLQPDDRVAIVVYAGASGLVLDSTTDHRAVVDALDRLQAGGSTNGGEGIELAYLTATRNHIPGGLNRVILCTDGDFNVGVTDRGSLTRLIEEKANQAETPTYLSILGFGSGNLQDATMEELSNRGDGNYGYIDSQREAEKLFVEQIAGTLLTIAKDVKIQVEFNPAEVAAYRLIGYENRLLADEDFNDDTVDAGDIGAGHTVTALYEVVLAERGVEAEIMDVEQQIESLVHPMQVRRITDENARIANEQLLTLHDTLGRLKAQQAAQGMTPEQMREEAERINTLMQIADVTQEVSMLMATQARELRRLAEAGGLPPKPEGLEQIDDLKYQTEPKLTDAADSGELLTLKLRYKAPDAAKEAGTSRLLEFAVRDGGATFAEASSDLRFAASVAGFGMLLRGSTHAGEASYSAIAEWADAAVADA